MLGVLRECVCGRVRGVSLSDLGSCLHSGDLDLNSLSPQTVHIHESNTHTHTAVRAHDQLSAGLIHLQ